METTKAKTRTPEAQAWVQRLMRNHIAPIFNAKRGGQTKTAFAKKMGIEYCTYRNEIEMAGADTTLSKLYSRCKAVGMEVSIEIDGIKINLSDI